MVEETEQSEQKEENAHDFNLLSQLICPPEDVDDNFKLNLFPDQFSFGSKNGKKDKDDDNAVFIDLAGEKPKNAKIEAVK